MTLLGDAERLVSKAVDDGVSWKKMHQQQFEGPLAPFFDAVADALVLDLKKKITAEAYWEPGTQWCYRFEFHMEDCCPRKTALSFVEGIEKAGKLKLSWKKNQALRKAVMALLECWYDNNGRDQFDWIGRFRAHLLYSVRQNLADREANNKKECGFLVTEDSFDSYREKNIRKKGIMLSASIECSTWEEQLDLPAWEHEGPGDCSVLLDVGCNWSNSDSCSERIRDLPKLERTLLSFCPAATGSKRAREEEDAPDEEERPPAKRVRTKAEGHWWFSRLLE